MEAWAGGINVGDGTMGPINVGRGTMDPHRGFNNPQYDLLWGGWGYYITLHPTQDDDNGVTAKCNIIRNGRRPSPLLSFESFLLIFKIE